MFLLIQIAFTVAAWRRGWRKKAALPWLGAFAIDFLAAFGAGLAGPGASPARLLPLYALVSIAMSLALVLMTAFGPRKPVKDSNPAHHAESPGITPQTSLRAAGEVIAR